MKAVKFLTLSLAVAALCLGYASCGDDDEDDDINEVSATEEWSISGSINGHDYVDLGLSVKWATCNVGADSPTDYGDYFAWGETTTKSQYTEGNSVTYAVSMGDISGKATYDAARANWGGTWRMPTSDEVDELINNCTTEWTTLSGVKGRKVTGPNGNSIFLPAAGWRSGTSLNCTGEYYYWSSTPYGSNTVGAYNLDFYDVYFNRGWLRRYFGLSIRPVSD